MITADQPTCFPDDVLVRVSSRSDGTVLDRAVGIHQSGIVTNRTKFCESAGISYGDVVFQRIIYAENRSYDLIAQCDLGSTTQYTSEVVADGLVTDYPEVGLFLPVADCIATVVYDPEQRRLGLFHLGRHSTLANLAAKAARHFKYLGSNAENLIVWMGPHAQKQSYKLQWLDSADDPAWQGFYEKRSDGYYLDMAGYNTAQLLSEGVSQQNIHVSSIDTVTNPDYFSHSQGDAAGRIGVVARRMRASS